MKYALVLCLLLTACGKPAPANDQMNGYLIRCIDGVKYVHFANHFSVKLNRDSKVELCDAN